MKALLTEGNDVESKKKGFGSDMWGDIIKVCGVGGCEYKMGHSTGTKRHTNAKYEI